MGIWHNPPRRFSSGQHSLEQDQPGVLAEVQVPNTKPQLGDEMWAADTGQETAFSNEKNLIMLEKPRFSSALFAHSHKAAEGTIFQRKNQGLEVTNSHCFWSDLCTYTHYIYKILWFFSPLQLYPTPGNPTALRRTPLFTWSFSLILQQQGADLKPSTFCLTSSSDAVLHQKIMSMFHRYWPLPIVLSYTYYCHANFKDGQ